MPKHADFQKIYNRFIKQYGSKEGKEFYHSWLNKKGYDDTKSFPKKGEKKEKLCIVRGVELKESGKDFHVQGFIATSHVDDLDSEEGIDIPDVIPKETLDSFANQINTTAEAGYHGIHHSEAVGKVYGNADVESNPAKVIELSDGNYALWADTKYLKENPEVTDIIKKWHTGDLNSFSITYDTNEFTTTDFDWIDDKLVRVLNPDTKLEGYTAASNPVNPNAKVTGMGFKEFKELIKKGSMEEPKMSEEKPTEPAQDTKPAGEDKSKETPEDKPEGEEKPEAKPEGQEEKEILTKEIKEAMRKNILAELKEIKPADAPLNNTGPKMETKELELKEFKEKINKFQEFKEKVIDGKAGQKAQWKECKEMYNTLKSMNMQIQNVPEEKIVPFEIKESEFKGIDYTGAETTAPRGCFPKLEFKENRLEMKGIPTHLTTDDDYSGAQTTFVAALANYEQSPARYNDIYGPYIVNQLNDETTTWNLLGKEDYSQYSAISVRVRHGRNATPDTPGFGSEPTWDGYSRILKLNQHFVTSYVEVAAEWESIEFGRGKGGIDVYQTELEFGALDLMDYLNGQVFGTGDGTSETAALGFEHLCKTHTAGATTLYGRARNTYTTLDSGGYEDLNTKPFTLDQARKMVETVRVNGARRDDLVFIMSLRQKRLFYQLIQDMQRIVPTSTRVGFTGQPELDGILIFEDKKLDDDSKTDDIYLIDTRHTKIGMKVMPTYVEMAQISLHRRGIVWMMWNLFSDAPNHNYWSYGAATS